MLKSPSLNEQSNSLDDHIRHVGLLRDVVVFIFTCRHVGVYVLSLFTL